MNQKLRDFARDAIKLAQIACVIGCLFTPVVLIFFAERALQPGPDASVEELAGASRCAKAALSTSHEVISKKDLERAEESCDDPATRAREETIKRQREALAPEIAPREPSVTPPPQLPTDN